MSWWTNVLMTCPSTVEKVCSGFFLYLAIHDNICKMGCSGEPFITTCGSN